MATAVSTSAWANDVKAGLPSSQARITLFRRGSSAICLLRHVRSFIEGAEHRDQPLVGAMEILERYSPPARKVRHSTELNWRPPLPDHPLVRRKTKNTARTTAIR